MQSGTLVAGRYRLEERLAAGGMGEVWKGFDTRLGRNVAVKILHAGLSSNDKFRTRFQLEARAVAALQSPGIVALYDYGEETGDEGLISYLVMELVQGRSLADILRERGTLPPDEVMKIVATAADALETAHRADIIHRDIKPANLLVDEDGTVKIVDFGIASARGASGLTETGTVMGTLAYASPEQLNGQELTGASDLYSLGIVAYEALMGQPPFVSDTPVAVMNGHMTQAPPPLSRDIPAGVAQVVLQSLQKDPRARYTSAAEMARSAREGRVVTGGIPVAPPSEPGDGSTQIIGSDATRMLGGRNTPRNITAAQPTGAIGPDGEKRNRALPWLITGGVTLGAALIVLLIFTSLRDDPPPANMDPEDGTTTPAETDSPTPTEEATTEEETDQRDEDDNWEEPTTEEPTSESPSPTPSETATTATTEPGDGEGGGDGDGDGGGDEPTDPTTSEDTATPPEGGGGTESPTS